MVEDLREKVLRKMNEEDLVNLLKDLVEIPSISEEESDIAKFLADFMRKRDFEVELQEVERDRFQVIGKLKGSGEGHSLMLCGHLDTFPPSLAAKDPYKAIVKDGRIYGLGAMDMKAGVAAMVMAANVIKEAEIKLKGDLIVAGVLGEEQGGVGIVHLLKKGITADMGIVTESTDLSISRLKMGITQFMISTIGRSAHLAYKDRGIDAIEKMMKVITALKDIKFTYQPNPDFLTPRYVVGSIIGGRGREPDLRAAQNISDFCSIIMDVRFVPGQNVESIRKDIEKVLVKIEMEDPEFKYEIKNVPIPHGNRKITRSPVNVPLNAKMIQILNKNHKYIVGEDVEILPCEYFSDDSSHMNDYGIETITYGPKAGADENGELGEMYVTIDSLITCTKVLTLTALDICNMMKK